MANDDPFKLYLLKQLTTLIETVSILDGYKNDLDGKVFRGRSEFGESDPLPLISILEVPLPPDQLRSPLGSGELAGDYDLIIQGFVPDDPDHPTDPAHYLMADIQSVLAKAKQEKERDGTLLGNKRVIEMRVGPGVVRPPDDMSAVAHFWMTLTLNIVQDLDTPYDY